MMLSCCTVKKVFVVVKIMLVVIRVSGNDCTHNLSKPHTTGRVRDLAPIRLLLDDYHWMFNLQYCISLFRLQEE